MTPVFLVKRRSPVVDELRLHLLPRSGLDRGMGPKADMHGNGTLMLTVKRDVVFDVAFTVVDAFPALIGFAGFTHIKEQQAINDEIEGCFPRFASWPAPEFNILWR